jgi:uncharacterized damage-inducible protein DinB
MASTAASKRLSAGTRTECSTPSASVKETMQEREGTDSSIGEDKAKNGIVEKPFMSDALLDALLESWDRNNTILVNLLRALPEGGLEVRAMKDSPSVGQLFAHMHYARLVLVSEDAPELARSVPEEEWAVERDRDRVAEMLNYSARAVRDAVKSKVAADREMNLHYDHPILLLQQMIWHEGYHHGQIKLALKLAGRPIADEEAGPLTWDVWMRKK